MTKTYTRAEVAELSGLTVPQHNYHVRLGIVTPSEKRGAQRLFSLHEARMAVIAAHLTQELQLSAEVVKQGLDQARKGMEWPFPTPSVTDDDISIALFEYEFRGNEHADWSEEFASRLAKRDLGIGYEVTRPAPSPGGALKMLFEIMRPNENFDSFFAPYLAKAKAIRAEGQIYSREDWWKGLHYQGFRRACECKHDYFIQISSTGKKVLGRITDEPERMAGRASWVTVNIQELFRPLQGAW